MTDSLTATDVFEMSIDFDQTVNITASDPFDASLLINLEETGELSKTSKGWTESDRDFTATEYGSLSENFLTGNLSDSEQVRLSDQFSRTDSFSQTNYDFNVTSNFTISDVFQPSVLFQAHILWRDLKSVWGYLAAIMVLTGFGTALMVRSLYLMQKLEWGSEMEDSESMFYSDEGEEEDSDDTDTSDSDDDDSSSSSKEESKKSEGEAAL
jgi:hypothetical protein